MDDRELESLTNEIMELCGHMDAAEFRLLELIRQSPLQAQFGDEIEGLSMRGPADVQLSMGFPLGRTPGEPRIDGRVLLSDNELAEARWHLRFDQTNGPIVFTRTGFNAEPLEVRMDGAPARLSLALGEFVSDPSHHLEGRLVGELPVASVFGPVSAAAPSPPSGA